MKLGRKILFSLAILNVAAVAWAAQIEGRVTTEQGAAVAGIKVTVVHRDNGGRWEATTKEDGTYAVADLESGAYTVTVAGASGQPPLRRELTLGSGAGSIRADFQFPAPTVQNVAGAEERNPNIFIYRIDLNELRNRLNVGRGPDPQYLPEFRPEQNYFGAEFGAALVNFEVIRSRPLAGAWRGSASGLHQNSALNARNFFNVGPLRPSRANTYSLSAGGPLASRSEEHPP